MSKTDKAVLLVETLSHLNDGIDPVLTEETKAHINQVFVECNEQILQMMYLTMDSLISIINEEMQRRQNER